MINSAHATAHLAHLSDSFYSVSLDVRQKRQKL